MSGYPLGGASVVMTVLVDAVEQVRIAEPVPLDAAVPAVVPGSSGCPDGAEHRPDPAVGARPLQQRFPIERFEDLERWIVERSAKVRSEMAAQGATWTVPDRAPEAEAQTRRSNVAPASEPGSPERGAEPPIEPPVTSLSRCELVVLANLAQDITLEAIASKLFVSRNTVKSHVRRVYRKIGVCTRADAIAWATVAGLR